MDLTDSIKKAGQQQSARKTQNTENIKKRVHLESRIKTRYVYTGNEIQKN